MTPRFEDADVDAAFRRYCLGGGDRRDLAEVYDALAAPLRREAAALLRDETAADDLVQNTFVAAIELRHTYDPQKGSARAWLRGLMRHRAMHVHRDRQRDAARSRPLGEIAMRDEDGVALRELAERTRAAVDRLPEPFATTVRRVVLQGECAEQVAAESGRPAATVRSHVHRGLRRVRAALPTVLAALARAAARRPLRVAAVAGAAAAIAWFANRAGDRPVPTASVRATGDGAAVSAQRDASGKGPGARVAVDVARRALGVAESEPAPAMAPAPSPLALRAALDGSPLANASVLLEDPSGALHPARAGADGRVASEWLGSASRCVVPWARIDQPLGDAESYVIDVPPGFAVRGVVRDGVGRPVEGAVVCWGPRPADEVDQVVVLARTDADGHFQIDHLSPSRPHDLLALTASAVRDGFDPRIAVRAGPRTEVAGSTGSVVDVELGLASLFVDPLVATDASEPADPLPAAAWLECEVAAPFDIEGWTVALLAGGADAVAWSGAVRARGVEVLEPPANVAHAVLLPPGTEPIRVDAGSLTTMARSRRVPIERGARRWVARFAIEDLPTIRCRLEIAGGSPTVVALDAAGRPGWVGRGGTGAGTSVDVGPLPAGEWTFAAARQDGLWHYRGPVALAAGAEGGVVRIEPPLGSASLSLGLPSGVATADARVLLCGAGVPVVRQPDLESGGALPLVPGRYELFWSAPGFAGTRMDLDLAAGDHEVALRQVLGAPVAFDLGFDAELRPVDGRATFDLLLRDAAGELVWRDRHVAPLGDGGRVRFTRELPIGEFRLTVIERRSARAEVDVAVPAGGPVAAELGNAR